jgi:Copine
MPLTIDTLVDASNTPLSVIIIGVGNENFENMAKLDCDEGTLKSSKGVSAKRDIVQFVSFKEY